MKKEFSFYEFVGVIAPGSVLLIILFQIFSDIQSILTAKDLSLGGLGVFVIASYAMGHLVQSLGNLIENMLWPLCGGRPTDWIIKSSKCKYLSEEQIGLIPQKVSTVLGLTLEKNLKEYNSKQWSGITRQIYAAVKQAKAAERVDIFNGNYGFFRGLAASFALGLIILTIETGFSHIHFQVIFFIFFILAIFRMHRFARHYATELFVQFLQIKE